MGSLGPIATPPEGFHGNNRSLMNVQKTNSFRRPAGQWISFSTNFCFTTNIQSLKRMAKSKGKVELQVSVVRIDSKSNTWRVLRTLTAKFVQLFSELKSFIMLHLSLYCNGRREIWAYFGSFFRLSEKPSPLNKVNIIYSCQCINIGTITFWIQDQSTEVRSEM